MYKFWATFRLKIIKKKFNIKLPNLVLMLNVCTRRSWQHCVKHFQFVISAIGHRGEESRFLINVDSHKSFPLQMSYQRILITMSENYAIPSVSFPLQMCYQRTLIRMGKHYATLNVIHAGQTWATISYSIWPVYFIIILY